MRLIDADALKEEVNKKKVVGRFNMLSLIDAAQTIIWCSETSEGYPLMDLRPREKGEWIRKVDNVGFVSHICSECGAEIEVGDPIDDKFCFNCGADMRKGGKEE